MTLKTVKITNTNDKTKTALKQKTVAKVKSDIRPAKAAFAPGEKVVYPCHGVGQIMTISKDEF
ncbi:MAG: hypothetical protein FWF01_02740, partial [Alphaproteobacteria bacterium]|nr:hypothetical protein [Alphaproteobacteria bacterium]